MGVGEREPGRVSDYPEYEFARQQVDDFFMEHAEDIKRWQETGVLWPHPKTPCTPST